MHIDAYLSHLNHVPWATLRGATELHVGPVLLLVVILDEDM